jgi:hypothetical protein
VSLWLMLGALRRRRRVQGMRRVSIEKLEALLTRG